MERLLEQNIENRGEIKKELRPDRIRMGLGTLLYQSEENGFQNGPVPTAIIRALGGDDRHLGILGSFGALGGIGHLFGNPLLRRFASNRKAMVIAMWIGFVFALALCAVLLMGHISEWHAWILPLFLGLFLAFAPVNGMQANIENSWIGDLVPKNLFGWFTKVKWMLSVLGVLLFSIGIARFCEAVPGFAGFAAIFGLFALSFFAAALFIYPKVADREPQPTAYFGPAGERMNYTHPVFLLLILQGLCWVCGRNIFFSFTSIYLMEQFHVSLTKIALLISLQQAVGIAVIYFIGNRSDRWGAKRPLMVFMTGTALSMSLWLFSAWFGIGCIIAYFVIGGLAGHTLTMLGNNYSLEIVPAKGRAAYFGVARVVGALAGFVVVFFSGWLVHHLHDFTFIMAGKTLGRYHLVFAVSMLIALSSQIPLLLIGNRRIEPLAE